MKQYSFLVCLLFLVACKKDKVDEQVSVDFTYSGNYSEAPCTVSFVAMPSADGAITWDFGDGSQGTGNNVTHVYTTKGYYTVNATLSASDNTAARKKYVNVSKYTKLIVTKAEGISPALRDNATNWDSGSDVDPDLYFKIFDSSGSEYVPLAGYIYNTNTYTVTYPYVPGVEITDLGRTFTLMLVDHDSGPGGDEVICSFDFYPTDFLRPDGSFPGTFVKSNSAGAQIKVTVQWSI